jgi:hypothetical protein
VGQKATVSAEVIIDDVLAKADTEDLVQELIWRCRRLTRAKVEKICEALSEEILIP